ADYRGTASDRLGDAGFDASQNLRRLWVLVGKPRGQNAPDPRDERRPGWNTAAQMRELEVRVRVDEPWENRHLAEVDVAASSGLPIVALRPGPEAGHAFVVDRDPPVTNRRLADGQHPRGVITDQFGMTRSCLPARLRAGYFSSSSGTCTSPSS